MKRKATVSIEKYEEMEKFYTELVKKKEAIIKELEAQNKALLNSALKQSEKNVAISEHAKSLLDLNKKLQEKLRFDKKQDQ